MGSRGSGSFTDYSGSAGGGKKSSESGDSSTGGSSGGSSGVDPCEKALGSIQLEEVARSPYYQQYKDVPPVSTRVNVGRKLVKQRIGVESVSGEVVGVLPTAYNYLYSCIQGGYSYSGHVIASSNARIPTVRIDLEPTKNG